MSEISEPNWYLVRTKPGKERWVRDQLSATLPEVFLPLLKAKTPRWGKLGWSVTPLFPCYLFARFPLQEKYFEVRYLAGVSGLVSAGNDPLIVPVEIVSEIRARGTNDVVELHERAYVRGEKVRVVHGPFRGVEAIFERYLSGTERVAVLLSAVEATGLRVILDSAAVARYR